MGIEPFACALPKYKMGLIFWVAVGDNLTSIFSCGTVAYSFFPRYCPKIGKDLDCTF
jgi:hypothetical protein